MPAAIRHDKIVVVFDLCSSSQIMEDLLLNDRFDRYETFLTCVKRWLMNWAEQQSTNTAGTSTQFPAIK